MDELQNIHETLGRSTTRMIWTAFVCGMLVGVTLITLIVYILALGGAL